MANVLKIKAGSGVPTTSDIVDREIAFNRSDNKLYINDSGTIVNLSGAQGGGSADEADRIVFDAQAGEALSKGDVIYISGISGNTPIVSKADADDANKMPAFGLAAASASLNNSVQIVTFGTLENFDTSAFSVGDTVFVSTTAGGLTATKPTGESGLIQNMGHIVRSHASTGAIKIVGAGRTAATPNLNQDKVFLGNASNQSTPTALSSIGLSKFNNDSGFTTNTGTVSFNGSTANGLLTYGNSTTADVESNLTFDAATGNFSSGDGSESVTHEPSSNYLTVHETGASKGSHLRLATDNSDFILTAGGSSNQLSLYDVNGAANRLIVNSSGRFQFQQDVSIPVAKKLFFGGGDHTYIGEDVDDRLRFFTGGAEYMRFNETGSGILGIYRDVYMGDSLKIHLGASNDLRLFHDSSNSYVYGYGTGNLYIGTTVDDADLILVGDDGSGGTTAYLTLDGSAGYTTVQKLIKFEDSVDARFGSSSDLRIRHDGTDSKIDNYTGTLKIRNTLDDADITLETDNGSGGVTPYITLDGSTTDLLLSPPGNVGIGTTSPGRPLVVNGSSATFLSIVSGQNDDGGILFGDSSQDYDGQIRYNNASHFMFFKTNNAEVMRIDSSGNVGIGTTSPGRQLHLSGEGVVRLDSTSADPGLDFNTAGTSDMQIRYRAASDKLQVYSYGTSTNVMTIQKSNGFVGIGTTSPQNKLHVDATTTSNVVARFNTDSTYTFIDLYNDDLNRVQIGNADDGDFIIRTAEAERFRINSSGLIKVGPNGGDTTNVFEIDTSGNSQHGLMINADQARAAGRYALYIDDEDPNSRGSVVIQTASGPSLISNADIQMAATSKLYLDGGGNTYITEEVPDQITLRAGGGNYFKVSPTNGVVVNDPGANVDFRVEGDTDQNLLFTDASADRVGIGTTSPDAKLEVSGSTNSDLFSLEGAGSSFKLIAESGSTGSADIMAYRLGLRYGSNDNGFIDFYRGPDGATGYLAFGASGSEAMRLDRFGNLGIGVASPAFSWGTRGIEIQGSGVNPALRLDRSDSIFEITARSSDILLYNTGTARSLRFGVGGGEKFRINSDGNTYVYETLILNANNESLLQRDTGGTVRNLIKLDSSNRVIIGDGNTAGVHHHYPSTYSQINTDHGYLQIGPQNTSHCHYTTDRANHWFNQMIYVNGGVVSSYNSDLQLRRNGASSDRIDVADTYVRTITDNAETFRFASLNRSFNNLAIGPINNNSKAYIRANNGYSTATTPDYTWWYNDQCGIYHPAGNTIGFSASGQKVLISTYGLYSADDIYINHGGSDYSPGLQFMGGSNTPGANEYENGKIAYYDNSGTAYMRYIIGRSAGAHEFHIGGTRMLSVHADGDIELRSDGSSQGAQIQRVGSIHFTWDRDTYGTAVDHCIRTISDDLVINSYDDVTINLDSNNNDSASTFDIRQHNTDRTSGTLLFQVDQSGNARATADVVAYYSSDKRLKNNLKPISNSLEKLQKLTGYEFDWNEKQDTYEGHDVGVVAQEVEEVLPEVVATRDSGYKAVKYEKMIPLLIEAIKEQQQQINELKEKLNG